LESLPSKGTRKGGDNCFKEKEISPPSRTTCKKEKKARYFCRGKTKLFTNMCIAKLSVTGGKGEKSEHALSNRIG